MKLVLADVGLGDGFDDETLRRAMPDNVDQDGSGNIELVEFLNLHQAVRVNMLFQKYDADESGFIDPAEIPSLLHEHSGHVLSEEEIKGALRALDSDKDGHVSLSEFEAWWDNFDAKKRFDSFAPNRDGKVSLAKMRRLLFQTLGREWVERKSSWIRNQMAKHEDEDVMLTFDEFRPWYFSIFRHTKHLIDDDDVVINVGKRTDWEAAIFADGSESNLSRGPSFADGGGERKHNEALLSAVAAAYGIDAGELMIKFGDFKKKEK